MVLNPCSVGGYMVLNPCSVGGYICVQMERIVFSLHMHIDGLLEKCPDYMYN